jgi:error-prone DNA polymerase
VLRRQTLTLPGYAELHSRSNFSFLSGASHPEELIGRAKQLGYTALALADECSLAGAVRAHVEAERLALPLIIGSEMRLSIADPPAVLSAHEVLASDAEEAEGEQGDGEEEGEGEAAPGRSAADESRGNAAGSSAPAPLPRPPHGPRLVLLAMSMRGYGNLVRWITLARRRAPKGSYVALVSDVEGKAPQMPMLAGLPDCLALLVAAEALAAPDPFSALYAQARWLQRWFGVGDRAAIAVSLLRRPQDALLLDIVRRVAALTGLPVVATGDAVMHLRSRKALHDVLTATRLKRTVADSGLAIEPNAERHLRRRQRLAVLYPAAWLEQTLALAARCSFSLAELKYQYPREIVPEGQTPTTWLRTLTERGARERYPQGIPDVVRSQIEHELALITRLQYEPYFLTVADIVHWAREQEILCQGRGSAANSTVCYCLGVTAVDPEKHQMLLFERFISVERNEPPDIDIDFEHQRREEVIQYIYRKYGRERAALTAVVISYRPRSALRDVGRALGIDLARIDGVAKGQHWFDGRMINAERLRENGFDPEAPLTRLWVELTQALIGFPRHLSQHPGGFVIARDDLADLLPVERAAMDGRSVVQWDKDDLDALRLMKVDVLALGMLSAIRRALEFIGAKRGRPLALHEVPQGDDAVYAMLSRADSIGVFQVESRAQMSMLPRLKPKNFYDLVIEVAIVRPGPIQGGMVHPFLRRRNHEEAEDIPSKELEKALKRTLGVPIFQEQVMQIAMIAADFTPGEADQLRRAMAAWKRKGGLGPFKDRLIDRMVQKQYSREFAERIFKQMEGFGEYGFPESHAASFALLVYDSAWIKHHHPDAFLAALLNSQPMGFYAPAQLVRDAKEHGVVVLPVDVHASAWTTELEDSSGGAEELRPVRLGFSRITGFAEAAAQRIVAARTADGPFANAEDLARRAALDAHALGLLAQADALRPLAGNRHQAAWAVAGVDARATALLRSTRTHEETVTLAGPGIAETVLADYRSTGLSLQKHPLALLRPALAKYRVQPAAVLGTYPNGRLARASGIVTHRQRPETAKGVIFVTLEDETGAVNVIVWPAVVEAQRRALLASTLLTVYGVWQREGEVRHLVAKKLIDHSALLQGLTSKSRDFH